MQSFSLVNVFRKKETFLLAHFSRLRDIFTIIGNTSNETCPENLVSLINNLEMQNRSIYKVDIYVQFTY